LGFLEAPAVVEVLPNARLQRSQGKHSPFVSAGAAGLVEMTTEEEMAAVAAVAPRYSVVAKL
jgi:hypothetical protein